MNVSRSPKTVKITICRLLFVDVWDEWEWAQSQTKHQTDNFVG